MVKETKGDHMAWTRYSGVNDEDKIGKKKSYGYLRITLKRILDIIGWLEIYIRLGLCKLGYFRKLNGYLLQEGHKVII